ncbi:hypothetical protein C0993_004430 [Termitomyces sp. T159_Od127]|nr:hypothetical protein C0993_004430 [Termitomyces sp. T159_Od127]
MEDKVASLQAQIQLLSDLHGRLQSLRHIPVLLLKPPMPALSGQTLRSELEQVRQVGDIIRAERVQEALRAARDSLGGDASDLNPNMRRDNRKRGRAPSPESPQPYVEEEKEGARSLFPDDDSHPLEFEGLAGYIREFNRTHESRLHLWRRTRGDDGAGRVLRYTCPDVLTAYMTLAGGPGRVVVESVAAFGPREKKSPHSESAYAVYRHLSQQIASMLESRGPVAVHSVVVSLPPPSRSSLTLHRASCVPTSLSLSSDARPASASSPQRVMCPQSCGCGPTGHGPPDMQGAQFEMEPGTPDTAAERSTRLLNAGSFPIWTFCFVCAL